MTLVERVTQLPSFTMSLGTRNRERTRTRDALSHRRITGVIIATATRRRPRQPGWSMERDILRIGRRSLRASFTVRPGRLIISPAGMRSSPGRSRAPETFRRPQPPTTVTADGRRLCGKTRTVSVRSFCRAPEKSLRLVPPSDGRR